MINFIDIICVLVLTSYSNFFDKIMMLYLIFDLDSSDDLSLNELTIIIVGIINGFCKITN